jgi:hypothetical protein
MNYLDHESTKGRKHEKKLKFRAHAAQAPALRVPDFACPVKPLKV